MLLTQRVLFIVALFNTEYNIGNKWGPINCVINCITFLLHFFFTNFNVLIVSTCSFCPPSWIIAYNSLIHLYKRLFSLLFSCLEGVFSVYSMNQTTNHNLQYKVSQFEHRINLWWKVESFFIDLENFCKFDFERLYRRTLPS